MVHCYDLIKELVSAHLDKCEKGSQKDLLSYRNKNYNVQLQLRVCMIWEQFFRINETIKCS